MTADRLRHLLVDLQWVKGGDPDAEPLTRIHAFHLSRAIREVRRELDAAEAGAEGRPEPSPRAADLLVRKAHGR